VAIAATVRGEIVEVVLTLKDGGPTTARQVPCWTKGVVARPLPVRRQFAVIDRVVTSP
jgi:hypothetical protein